MEAILRDMRAKELLNKLKAIGIEYLKRSKKLTRNEEELALHMQLNYKQAVEIAKKQAINNVLIK